MTFRCDCTGHILNIEDMRLKEYPALSFQIYDIYSEKGRKLKKPRLLGDVIMNNKYPKEYDKLMRFLIASFTTFGNGVLTKKESSQIFKPDDTKSMKWYKNVREDGRIEYVCEHGVGHSNEVHGCCGYSCCRRKDYPLKKGKQ